MTGRLSKGGFNDLQDRASEAARLMKLFANEHRLLVLCQLADRKEMSVNKLAEAVQLSQSALSQHLARLREDGVVTCRRESQTAYYRIADPNTAQLLRALKQIFCD
jgi:DNA-binding transcriptional ArsR family regulator